MRRAWCRSPCVTSPAGRLCTKAKIAVPPGAKELRSAAGVLLDDANEFGLAGGKDVADVGFAELAYAPFYVPVGAKWTVGSLREDGSILPLTRFGTTERAAVLLPGSPGAGRFALYAGAGAGEVIPLTVNTARDARPVELAAAELPWGGSRLHLRYLSHEGEVWLVDSVALTVGSVSAVLTPLQVEPQARVLTGELRFSTDAPEVEAQVIVDAVFTRLVWDAGRRAYTEGKTISSRLLADAIRITGGARNVPLVIPFPEDEVAGLWRVALNPQVTIREPVPVEAVNRAGRLFTTYRPAQR